jgi:hypothetical protein
MKINIFSSPLLIVTAWGKIYKRFFSVLSSSTLSLKSYCFLLVIFLFFISDSIAQNFFPLQVGNIYQVKNDWYWYGPGGTGDSGTDYYSFVVLDDTVINGEVYFNFSNNPALKHQHWFRYDSLLHKLFMVLPNDPIIRLAIDFNAPNDTNYTSYLSGEVRQFTSYGMNTEVVFGDTCIIYSMHSTNSVNNHLFYKFADNIGIVRFENYGGLPPFWSSSTHNTISAVIDSIVYNRLELKVDSLYPTFDRPIDTFPYLLTIPYTASYSALVDSFYLALQHIRSDTLVQSKRYNISKSNPRITFILTDLMVGDKIKLKATITDTSIYYNTDVYPDTGWIVINVLPPILNVEGESKLLTFNLAQNYPNPFNPITRIRYQILEPELVTIKVYDVLGNEIETLVQEEKTAGSYEIDFDGSSLTSGIYYYRITAGDFSQAKKMILLK